MIKLHALVQDLGNAALDGRHRSRLATASPAPADGGSDHDVRRRRRADRAWTERRHRDLVFDATSGRGARRQRPALRSAPASTAIDLTPAAIGPYVVPTVNLECHLDAPNVNMVTCGGQATIPIVAAINRVTEVHYAEIVASIASKARPAPARAPTSTSSPRPPRGRSSEVGGATRGKAIIVLNPAEPPLIMRDTVFCIVDRDCRP